MYNRKQYAQYLTKFYTMCWFRNKTKKNTQGTEFSTNHSNRKLTIWLKMSEFDTSQGYPCLAVYLAELETSGVERVLATNFAPLC